MPIDKIMVARDVIRALTEDVGTGDVSAALLEPDLGASADIISREPMLVCGKPWVDAVFSTLNSAIKITWLVAEGEWLDRPATLCQIQGTAKDILTGERTALNFLQTLSATATQTFRYNQQLKGTRTRLLDTRKTIPGLRYAQKYAVACGGGNNHRHGLYDAFLIKENHIKACGSISEAVRRARSYNGQLLIEVEVETLAELEEALQANPQRILLDNFSLAMLQEAVKMRQDENSECELEASGGMDLVTVATVAATGVDYVSSGSLTKSIQAIDLSLLIRTL